MSDPLKDAEELRQRFGKPPRDAASGPECPAAETFWPAGRGELSREELGTILDHVATCAACTVAWRLTREHLALMEPGEVPEAGPARSARRVAGRRRDWRWWAPPAAVAAALMLVALLVPWRQPETPSGPVLRTLAQEPIRSLVAEGAALPADGFTLRWTAGPEGSYHAVRVTDRRLNLLAGARSLDEATYTVPAEALSGLEAGTVILWQVETVLPDGRRAASETFTVQLR